jgi:hypothetical protein
MFNAIALNSQLESMYDILRSAVERRDDHVINELRKATKEMAIQCRDLVHRKALVEADEGLLPIDSDLEIRHSLERAREGIRAMHDMLVRTPEEKSNVFITLRKTLEDVYIAINELQWEIGEHDASRYAHGTPALVSTKEELYRALDAIRAGK